MCDFKVVSDKIEKPWQPIDTTLVVPAHTSVMLGMRLSLRLHNGRLWMPRANIAAIGE